MEDATNQVVKAWVALRYPLERIPDEWELPEVPVPESVPHDRLVEYLKALLVAWAERSGHSVLVARNLAVRWVEERPRVGIDPDVCIVDPDPPNSSQLASLKLWQPGCSAPRLAIEVVSANHPYKDYVVLPERYAAMGAGELWVIDHQLVGPRRLGGPFLIQLWAREPDGTLVRRYAGDGPVYSEVVGGWVCADPVRAIVLCSDESGQQPWLTLAEQRLSEQSARSVEAEQQRVEAEQQRAEAEQQRVEAEQQRAEAEQQRAEAEQRAASLAAQLRALGVEPTE